MPDRKQDKVECFDFREALNSFGFLFPSNEKELEIFTELQKGFVSKYVEEEMSQEEVLAILNDETHESIIIDISEEDNDDEYQKEWKMVARNQNKISQHILDRMKKNQEDKLSNDGSS